MVAARLISAKGDCRGPQVSVAVPRSLSTRLILEVGQAILVADGLEATIEIILEGARLLTGAESVGLVQPDPTSGLLRCSHTVGRDAEALLRLPSIPVGDGIVGRAVAQGGVELRLNERLNGSGVDGSIGGQNGR